MFIFKYENDEHDYFSHLIARQTRQNITAMIQPGGQSIVDRILAAKNTIVGQAVAKVVCKATTEEIMGPKRKHLDCKFSRKNLDEN